MGNKNPNSQIPIPKSKGEIIVYQAENGQVKLDVRLQDETVWLTQQMITELFQTTVPNISMHIRNIYAEGELAPEATVKKFLTVRREGDRDVRRELDFYNLDMIISVGYRVKSLIATRFRIWATHQLKEYIIKGFVMDDERLKNPPVKGSTVPDYFDEMLERIRDIRASERRMYLRVREIFAMAVDYEHSWPKTTKFFSIIQNKLHFAATGMTAAELIKNRADHVLPNMGITSWKAGEVRKTDVTIAKNYLKEEEIDELNRIVVMWLDFAEDQARRRKQVFMKDWERKFDGFLRFNERNVLPNAGKVSKQDAEEHAKAEYEQFCVRRRIYKESIGEAETIKQLEEAAKKVKQLKESENPSDEAGEPMSIQHINAISNRLSLRPPQRDSLEILSRVCEIISLEKDGDTAQALETIKSEFATVEDFERDFPSLCFALATGVGKTRLMGAFISYLFLSEGIRHFFVLAPNLTIYNKLIADFTPNTPKYVFKGISELTVNPPKIITGDNYESGRGIRSGKLFDTSAIYVNV